MQKYLEMKHAELVPVTDLQRPVKNVVHLPMHAVRKEDSTMTKLRVVFDASASSTTGQSLNDLLLVGPTRVRDTTPILVSSNCSHGRCEQDVPSHQAHSLRL